MSETSIDHRRTDESQDVVIFGSHRGNRLTRWLSRGILVDTMGGTPIAFEAESFDEVDQAIASAIEDVKADIAEQ